MRTAVIIGGVVANVVLVGEGWAPPEESVAIASETAEIGDLYSGGVFTKPTRGPLTVSYLMAYAAERRWQVETGGIIVAGAAIDTSRESQSMITGAYSYSQANPAELIRFKAASGWVTLDAPTVAAIATAVGAHVQACFAAEEAVSAGIVNGIITTTAEIDATAWPG